jgi:hypothetical protein
MKKMTMFIMIGATVALLALPVSATNLITDSNNSTQTQCKQEEKDAWYTEFLKIRTTDQAKAFDLAKKYLACAPAGEITEPQQKIIDYLTKWSTAYEDGMKKIKLTQLIYNDKKYPEAYALGREILAKEPENLKIRVDLGANGYLVAPLKDAQLNSESLEHARKALQLIESGKTVDDWAPLANKEAAMAYLNFTIGTLSLEKEPVAALKSLIRAAQFETPLKKSPFAYAYIAAAYETGPYAKQSEEYKTMYGGKDETPESKLALANIHQLVDRMIDGYARAVALAGNDTQLASQKALWLESLTTWYKYRNQADTALTGMNELIASVLSKPLPPEPTPLTSLPPTTPAATPINNTGTPTNGNGAASSPASNTTTKPATTTSAKPANPDRPRNR